MAAWLKYWCKGRFSRRVYSAYCHHLGGYQLVRYYADILWAILCCISDKEEKVRVVARETNEGLRSFKAFPGEGFDVGAILAAAKRHLSSEWEATRIEALH